MRFDTIDLWIIIKHTKLVKPDTDSVQIYPFRCLCISCEMRDSFKSALKAVGLVLPFHLRKVKIKIACLYHGYIIILLHTIFYYIISVYYRIGFTSHVFILTILLHIILLHNYILLMLPIFYSSGQEFITTEEVVTAFYDEQSVCYLSTLNPSQ